MGEAWDVKISRTGLWPTVWKAVIYLGDGEYVGQVESMSRRRLERRIALVKATYERRT